jgi:hypothetical protein
MSTTNRISVPHFDTQILLKWICVPHFDTQTESINDLQIPCVPHFDTHLL